MGKKEVAQWLHDKIIAERYMTQSDAASEIADKFGEQYTYPGESGNLRIDKGVLYEFGKLKDANIDWDPTEREWSVKMDIKNGAEPFEIATIPELRPFPEVNMPEFKFPDFDIELPDNNKSN